MESPQEEDAEFVIRELAKYRKHDDIVMTLCERSGYKWEEAASFVRCIEHERSNSVRSRRKPFLTFLGLLWLIGGLTLTAYSLYSLLTGELMTLTLRLFVIELELPNGGQIVVFLAGLPLLLAGTVGIWLAVRKDGKRE